MASDETGYCLRFMHTALELDLSAFDRATLAPMLDFFASHFELSPLSARGGRAGGGNAGRDCPPAATLRFLPYAHFDRRDYAGARFEPVVMRRSSAANFNLHGDKALAGGLEIVDCPRTGTAFAFDWPRRSIDVFSSDRSEIQLIEFLREIVIRHEEHHDTMVVHAAALAVNGCAVLIAGRKGAGKSTLLLDLVGRPAWGFLSGDKVLLEVDAGGVRVNGWPDYPHLGCGTIRANRRLLDGLAAQGVSVEGLPPEAKLLIRPEVLARALGFEPLRGALPLGAVLLPDVRGSESARVVPAPPAPERLLEGLEFSADNVLAGWHGFFPRRPSSELRAGPVRLLADHLRRCRFARVLGPGPYPDRLEEVLA